MGSTFLRSASGQVNNPAFTCHCCQPFFAALSKTWSLRWHLPEVPEAAELIQKEKTITQKQVHTNKRLTSGRGKDSADPCGSKPSQPGCTHELRTWPWGDVSPSMAAAAGDNNIQPFPKFSHTTYKCCLPFIEYSGKYFTLIQAT